ncbi:MAG: HD domain-containing phosphohydrolase, partial [Desulfuromonadaceae bacterium]
DAERKIINKHPQDGRMMLEESGLLTEEAKIITGQHHERDDGKGYPNGLTGNDIHPYARICRLADVYEALTADRSYHKRHSTFEAFKIMQKQFTSELDRKLYELFLKLFSA